MQENLIKYAELLVKTGINIKKGQILVVRSPIECASFVRTVAEVAYQAGASDVQVLWGDEKLSKITYLNAPDELFDTVPSWQVEFYLSYARQDAAFLSIAASDPELMKAVDPDRIMRSQRVRSKALSEYQDRLMNNKNVWCVASIPTVAWAKKVFPNVSDDEAIDQLWQAIFNATRVNEDNPVKAWEVHKNNLSSQMKRLNALELKSLHYTNSLGTDLTIDLPQGHLWLGGADYTPEGHEFIANMPTEEVFTAPYKTGVNGVVKNALPLNLNGNIVDGFELHFKEGKVVDFKAEEGYDALKGLLETDEGSRYLGEVALVPYDSPISNTGILFYNTLFDENASCHLALGKAYPVCVEGGDEMTKEALAANGINDSVSHVDFMVGTSDLKIVGQTASGQEIIIFENGNFK